MDATGGDDGSDEGIDGADKGEGDDGPGVEGPAIS